MPRWTVTLALLACLQVHASEREPAACAVGAYRMADGRIIDVAPATDGLRWRLFDGRTGLLPAKTPGLSTLGYTGQPDGHAVVFDSCQSATLTFDGVQAHRIPLVVVETTFSNGGQTLAGRLVLPAGDAPVPVAVLVHGSEAASALTYAAWQRLLPAAGIGAFVYDKRGTGQSTGRYTQDFHVLAADAAAAAREARRLAGSRMDALVYAGGSQGGWVAPLAHRLEPADRLIVGYGLTVSPLEENRSEVLQDLAAAGYGADALAAAGEVVDATATLMATGFRDGYAEYARVRRLYRAEPWFTAIDGEFSGQILKYPPWLLKLIAPVARRKANQGTPWRHDPMPVLRDAGVPMLWVLAGADTSAPPEQTRTDLQSLQADGHALTILEFPNTEHGIHEFMEGEAGKRVYSRVAAGYLAAVVEFARCGELSGASYGYAQAIFPKSRAQTSARPCASN